MGETRAAADEGWTPETLDLVRRVEMCALRAWPALESADYGGWVLRHSQGITRRANSVLPNAVQGEHLYDLAAARAAVEEWYARRGARARYQICVVSQPEGLDACLAAAGYGLAARTGVHLVDLEEVVARGENLGQATRGGRTRGGALTVQLFAVPPGAWWTCYAEGDGLDAAGVTGRQQIMAEISHPAGYALTLVDGEPAAVGSAVVDGEFVGFFNIATRPRFRRMGAALAAVQALARWGLTEGAHMGYLQVMDQNVAARALYAGLGFVPLYHYHYREQP
jgi:GNAT superfamily N-acetyltransferase